MAQFQPPNLVRMKQPKPPVLPHGVAHQTPAIRHAHTLALGSKPRATKFVKGSAAAKKHMASLRAMRKKKAA